MSFIRGQAVTGFPFLAIDTGANPVITGTMTCRIIKDGGAQAACTNAAAHVANGQWKINLTATEMDASIIGLLFSPQLGIPVHYTIKTVVSGASAGAVQCVLNIRDTNGDGQPDTEVWITSDPEGNDIVAGTTETDGNGLVTFELDPGTYYRWAQKNGENFENPQEFTVTA